MNKKRSRGAFSLIEVLASLFVLSVSAMGITAAWRLADYQELLARADRRAERILREYYELQTFAPANYRPFVRDDNSPGQSTQSSITGFLYHPRLVDNHAGSSTFGDLIPFTISMANGNAVGTSQLVLVYTIPSYGAQGPQKVTKTVILNP